MVAKKLIDGTFSLMGMKTEKNCDGLRLQLGKGADPWFDYHRDVPHSQSRKVSRIPTTENTKVDSKNSVAFRSLGRDRRSKSLPSTLVYRVKYDITLPRIITPIIHSPGRATSSSSASDLVYSPNDSFKPNVPKFDKYTSRRPPGKTTTWDVRDPVGVGLNDRCSVDITNQLPRSYFDKELVSYFEPSKYKLPDPAVHVPSFQRMTRPGDHIHLPELRTSDFQPPLDGNRRIMPVFIGQKSRTPKQPLAPVPLIALNPRPEHYFY